MRDSLLQKAIQLQASGKLLDAWTHCRKALALDPADARSLHVLAQIEFQQGRYSESLRTIQRAVNIKPNDAEYATTLGGILTHLGSHEEALNVLQKAAKANPRIARLHYNFGITFQNLGKPALAEKAYRHALELKPDHPECHANLGCLLIQEGQFALGARHCALAFEKRPSLIYALRALVIALSEQGRLKEVINCRRKLVDLFPDSWEEHNGYLATLFYDPDISPSTYLNECQQWGARNGAFPSPGMHGNVVDPERPLRIGYISSHLNFHVVGRLLLPLFKHHDRSKFSIYCYASGKRTDATTDRLKASVDYWRAVQEMPETETAKVIREDHIDILVDTIGHFGGGVLKVFAERPAPVSVTHFGHFTTTGLTAIDYRFSDCITDPMEGPLRADAHHSEKLIRLDPCAYCYLPEDPGPPAGPLPYAKNGYVMFGNLNTLIKMSDPCVALWSKVLREVKNSRIMLIAHGDQRSKDWTRRRFTRHGISAARLELLDKSSHEEYLARFNQIDIALDPFPYNGDNTTCDSLWAGVPVLTLAGTWSIARRSISHLSAIGLEDWIAWTPQEYVAKAVGFSSDPSSLSQLRSGLRARMLSSELCNPTAFAKRVEAAYRAMWMEWCKTVATGEQKTASHVSGPRSMS